MSAMKRLYRVMLDSSPSYVVDDGASLRRVSTSNGSIFEGIRPEEVVTQPLANLPMLAPVRPSKIVCVGLNYKDHAAEVKKALPAEPLLFLKPSTAVIDPGAAILLPPGVGRVDYEGELAVVIGRRAHRVPASRAWDYIFGLTCVNDVTARDLQNKESQYTRCKGFDTFAPIGPCIALEAEAGPRAVETLVNGTRRQFSSTAQLIFGLEHLVEFITFVMTLEPGDVISTGTPSGIGPLQDGDTVTVNVEGIGALTNPVRAET
jgi:2-keto-4-pentenoate hydratase/2-oxohepta-3-ene-1,7-dioic acid hydratase in catechol pathway